MTAAVRTGDTGDERSMTEITIPVSDSADLTFAGRRLAHTSTSAPGRPRWTELTLYRRDDGGYVFQRVGRSSVYHRPDCRKVWGRVDLEPLDVDELDDAEDSPCDECHPDRLSRGKVVFERDKFSAVSVEDARRLISAMHDRDRATQELRLSKLSQELLTLAAEDDVGVREAARQVTLGGVG